MEKYKRTPQISVIVPVYNVEKWLAECIDSILKQTMRDFELILVDDGSCDSSGDICDAYAARDARVSAYHQRNAGVSAARNHGMKIATGNYIAFVDSDDWVEPDYLEAMLECMQPAGMVAAKIVGSKNEKYSGEMVVKTLAADVAQEYVLDVRKIGGSPCAKLFDRKLIAEYGMAFDMEIAILEDTLFALQYLSHTREATTWLQKSGYHYRVGSWGATRGRYHSQDFHEKYLTEYEAARRMKKYLLQTPSVDKAYHAYRAKAAVNTLRVMTAQRENYANNVLYQELLKEVRQNCLPCLVSNYVAQSSKISIFLSSISPEWEWYVWKKRH